MHSSGGLCLRLAHGGHVDYNASRRLVARLRAQSAAARANPNSHTHTVKSAHGSPWLRTEGACMQEGAAQALRCVAALSSGYSAAAADMECACYARARDNSLKPAHANNARAVRMRPA